MLRDVLASILVCPSCRGALSGEDDLTCSACRATFPVRGGIPRMTGGAEPEDERMGAEWRAQAHAHALYIDPTLIMNNWEKHVLPPLVDWIGDAHGTILDVGCGVGRLGAALAELGRMDLELVGADFQGTLIEEARSGYAALVEADVHRLPFRDGAFDAVIASNSLHHFPDVATAMVEIARVLRRKGVIVAYDPRFVTPLEKLKKLLRAHDQTFTKDHKAFRADEYRNLLGSSGLTVTDVRTVDPLGPLLATAFDYVKIGRLGVAGMIAKTLATADRLIAGSAGRTPLGLMLVGRAVKPSSRRA